MSLLKTLTRLTLINFLTRVKDWQCRQNLGENSRQQITYELSLGVAYSLHFGCLRKAVRGKETTSKIGLCCLDKRVGGKFQMQKKEEKKTMLFRNETD